MNGLVLNGGGASGSFTAGVLYELFDKIEFHRIYGTSVGALNATLLAQAYLNRSPDIIKEVWLEKIKRNKDVYNLNYFNFLRMKPPVSFAPLEKIIDENADLERICHDLNKEIVATSVDLLSGETKYFSNYRLSPGNFKKAIMASAAVPFFVKPVELQWNILVDGGVRENAPVKKMIRKEDIDQILIILTSPIEADAITYTQGIKEYKSTLRTLTRTANIMLGEITMNDLRSIRMINMFLKDLSSGQVEKYQYLRNKRIIDVDAIVPDVDIIGDLLEFNQKELKKSFDLGINHAKKYLAEGPDLNLS